MSRVLSKEEARALFAAKPKRSKYGAVRAWRCTGCGAIATKGDKVCAACGAKAIRSFDSRAEARRFDQLMLMQRAGVIHALRCQPKWLLVIKGEQVGSYTADFEYRDRDGRLVVEDVKGGEATRTEVYKIKRMLMRVLHRIDVVEIG